MSSHTSHDYALIDRLVEEFAARYRRGERPAVQEYLDRYPDLADLLRQLLPAQAEIEQVREDVGAPVDEPNRVPTPPLRQLGDYQMLREIGQGGMGIVYEAEQLSLGRRVALKVLPSQALATVNQKRRFAREAKAAGKLHHTNIVPIYGVGEHEGMPYYAMEFIQGLGLDEVIEELRRMHLGGAGAPTAGKVRAARRDLPAEDLARSLLTGEFRPAAGAGLDPDAKPDPAPATPPPGTGSGCLADTPLASSSSVVLPGWKQPASGKQGKPSYWQSVANIGVQVAGALDYAHKQGILHRDIKPSNLLLDLQGTVWVTDFGLAKAEDQPQLTLTGDLLGTLRYMPPEAFEGKSEVRSDVYSLGLTLYELLALRPAFPENERNKLIKQVSTAQPPRLERLNRAVPCDLATIVHKAMEREPARRYASAGELEADLHRFLADAPIRARRVSTVERLWRACRHNPLMASLLAAVALALLVGTAVASYFAIQADHRAQEAEQAKTTLQHSLYFSDLRQVQALWGQVPLGQIMTLLDGQRPERTGGTDLRGFEWYYWRRRCSSMPHRIFQAHTVDDDDMSVAYSPVGRLLAYGSIDGTVRIWDTNAPEKEPLLVKAHDAGVGSVAFSRNGKLLASASWDQDLTLKIWDAATGRLIRTLPKRHIESITAVVFDPDGKRLASASNDETVRVWDATTGEQIHSFKGHKGNIGCVAFSPDGCLLASGGTDKTVRIWDAATGKTRHILKGHSGGVQSVAFSPDGQRLASASEDKNVGLWDVAAGGLISFLIGHGRPVHSVSFSPDGQRLASASEDGSVRVWDGVTGQEAFSLWGHTEGVYCVVFSPDGRWLASAGGDHTVRVWDAAGYPEAVILRSQPKRTHYKIAFDPNGSWLASADETEGTLNVWDPITGKAVKAPRPGGHALAVSPDGKNLASALHDGTIKVWDADSGEELSSFRAHPHGIMSLAFNHNGTLLASSGGDYFRRHEAEVAVWDWASRKKQFSLEGNTAWVCAVVFNPEGTRLATAGDDRTVKVWDATTGKVLLTLTGHTGPVVSVAFSPNGRQLASAGWDATVRTWDVDPRRAGDGDRLVRKLQIHTSIVTDVVFSPDGRRLASAGADQFVRIWDTDSGQEVLALKGHTGTITNVAFSPDGRRLASASWDGTIRIWDATPVAEAGE